MLTRIRFFISRGAWLIFRGGQGLHNSTAFLLIPILLVNLIVYSFSWCTQRTPVLMNEAKENQMFRISATTLVFVSDSSLFVNACLSNRLQLAHFQATHMFLTTFRHTTAIFMFWITEISTTQIDSVLPNALKMCSISRQWTEIDMIHSLVKKILC